MGCASVQRSLDNYQACKADAECSAKMAETGRVASVVTKTAASGFPMPSVPEALAWVVSNIATFAYGVSHGKRKKG